LRISVCDEFVKSGQCDMTQLPLRCFLVENARVATARRPVGPLTCPSTSRIGYVGHVTDLEGQEIELKLELDPADLNGLQQNPRIRELSTGRAETRQLRSVYFDTPALDLAARGIGLRVRTIGRQRIQTVKTRGGGGGGGLFVRGEFECPAARATAQHPHGQDARSHLRDRHAAQPARAARRRDGVELRSRRRRGADRDRQRPNL
jgi:hypothetical protein